MPKDEWDSEDPLELVGVSFPAEDESSMREMAECFAEEFARQGWERDRLMALFRSPFHAGPYMAWRALGPETVTAIVDEALRVWQPFGPRPSHPDAGTGHRRISLPVIQSEQ